MTVGATCPELLD
ncbi:unnamed protein product, partial [Allacma fusca]